MRKKRRIFQRARTVGGADVIERRYKYKRALNEYNYCMRRAKEENWKKFVSGSNLDPWGPVYRACHGRYVKEGKHGGRFVTMWSECAKVLLERFFPVAGVFRDGNEGVNEESGGCVDECGLEEVEAAVRKARLRKSPGLDGVTSEILRAVWKAIPGWLVRLYDACSKIGCFPAE